ncbi:MAG: bifunctional phosphopantothenoylcysteine decarboxylase/phosphopantothenate--cysteine ligase CoaBC [Tunicatimonas sp.]
MALRGKKVLVGVTGSIAAYKAAWLVRGLIKAGAEVQVLMTEGAQQFITPLTLATLSKRPVLTNLVADAARGTWNNHVDLGLWADALLIAPATAHTLAKLTTGLSDDLLTAVYLSARCPVLIAPAMDLDMYQHPTTRRNRQALRTYGNHVLDAPEGELASGLSGAGRMMEPDDLVRVVEQLFHTADSLAGKRVLITAGPTHEPIDPVRFLSNASSGKMGYALAEEAARRGAEVHLISGPTALETNHPNIHLVRVQTAQEMLEATQSVFPTANLAIFAAAVADYTPQQTASQKIKKSSDTLALALTKTVDIAQSLSAQKQAGQRTVGFALETENELKHAAAKLKKKHLDMIVLNSLNDAGAGFGHDTNQIKILTQNMPEPITFPLKDKRAVAADIFDTIISTYYA